MGSKLNPPSEFGHPLLRVKGLSKRYVQGGRWRNRTAVTAVDGVDLEIMTGTTLALIGASGSGKSTVARCVAELEKPDSGQILINQEDLAGLATKLTTSGAPNQFSRRSRVQLVFQDAATAMNPRFTAQQVVEEPLLILGMDSGLRREAAEKAVDEVGLPADWLGRPAMDFSGGQRQRLAIARALVNRPKLLILDEALTGLDLSTQAQVANLLLDLQEVHSLTYLLISHDFSLVARMADTVAVMARGQIVENGPVLELMTVPKREETLRLLAPARADQLKFAAFSGKQA
jgi:ABC-type glutathione transport system ATPase component